MKRTFLILCIIALVVACNNLMAQDDKTSFDRSRKISDQLKNGTAPGLKFGPHVKRIEKNVSQPTAEERAGTISSQMKKGGLQGTNIARGGGSKMNRTAMNARRSAAGQPLPSEKPAGSEPLKARSTTGETLKEPTQGGVQQPETKVSPKTIKNTAPVTTETKEKQ